MNAQNGTLRNSVPQQKQPEVTAEVENLNLAAKYLEESLTMLEGRLAPVLAERKLENGVGGTGAPEPVRVPLAEELHAVVSGFQRIRDRVDSVVARLEI